MTDSTENPIPKGQESLLPAAPVDISRLRVTRSELARFLGCTKQTTGEWARKGIVTFADYDQRVNLNDALRQVLARCNLKWLRVRVLRDLARDMDAYRERIAALEQRATEAEAEAKEFEAASTLATQKAGAAEASAERAARNRYNDTLARGLYRLEQDVIEHFSVLVAAHRRGDLEAALDRITDAIFYPGYEPERDADADNEPLADAGAQPEETTHEDSQAEQKSQTEV